MSLRRRPDRDFADEIQAHLEHEADRLEAEGMDRSDAMHAARRSFGNVIQHRERFYASVRWMLLDNLWRDIRYGARSLRRDVGLLIFATVIVGLGIGATASVFSVIHALLIRPLPFAEPDRLVWISNGEWGRGQQLSSLTVQVNHVRDLRSESRTLSDVAGFHQFDRAGDHTLSGGGPARLTRLRTTGNFLPLLGVEPHLGRHFSQREAGPGGPAVIMLTYNAWLSHFGADSTVVGRTVTIDSDPYAVIGVTPRDFDFGAIFEPGRSVDYLEPYPLSDDTNRSGNTLTLIGRLEPAATVGAAQQELTALAARTTPDRRNSFEPHVRPLTQQVSGRYRSMLYLLAGAVGLVMLIVCANVANLLLARGTSRAREMAMRAALGAGRARLLRQLLTESTMLSLLGAAVGTGLAWISVRLLSRVDVAIPLLHRVQLNWSVLAFVVLLSVVTGVLLGIVPALRLSSTRLHNTLKEGSRSASAGRRQTRVRHALVVTEVAMACVLLVGAGLLLRSFGALISTDLGFRPEETVTLRIDRTTRFPTRQERAPHYQQVVDAVRAAPGIVAAGTADILPMGFNRRWCVADTDCTVDPFVRVVSPGYVAAMGLTLLSGRDFERADTPDSPPVAMVNETLADRMWPGQDAVGQSIRINGTTWNVVGVVRGTRYRSADQQPGPEVFFSMWQIQDFRAVHLVVRGAESIEGLTATVRNVIRRADPTVPVGTERPMEAIVAASMSPRRFLVTVLGGFAGLALVLASLGIYSVISHTVSQRRHETGIRLALGAPPSALRSAVLLETLRLSAIGLGLGLGASLLGAQLLRSLLFQVNAFDPLTFGAVVLVLGAVGALAGLLPARRASNLDPTSVLDA